MTVVGPATAARDQPFDDGQRTRHEILSAGRLGGCEPAVLAAEYGTPLYVYDLETVSRQAAALATVLPPAFELAYAVKANPAVGIIAHVASLGLGADVASGGELEAALRAGVPSRGIVMTGPGKREDELRAATAARIRAVTVESLGELQRLADIASEAGVVVPVLLRSAVTPEMNAEGIRLVGDDGVGKFGMGPDDLAEAAARSVRSPGLDPIGVHSFGASNVLDPEALSAHVEATVEVGSRLAVLAGFPLRLVDAGGGLGIPYGSDQEPLDVAAFGRRLHSLASRMEADPVTRHTRVLLEPGRFLLGPAGAYLARVVDRKSITGRTVVILDGGIHHLLRPALTGQQHRIRRLGHANESRRHLVRVSVAGPLCSGLDVFATDTTLDTPEVGDLLAVLDTGAYGFTESMPYFLSHPIPAEIAVSGGRASLLRPRMEPAAWLDAQRLPAW